MLIMKNTTYIPLDLKVKWIIGNLMFIYFIINENIKTNFFCIFKKEK